MKGSHTLSLFPIALLICCFLWSGLERVLIWGVTTPAFKRFLLPYFTGWDEVLE